MEARREAMEQLEGLLSGQRFAVLSTRRADGHPYASLIAFAPSEDRRSIVFATLRATSKFSNMEAEPHVAVLIDNRSNQAADLREAAAVTAIGRAVEVPTAERTAVAAGYTAHHPELRDFVAAPGCALIRIEVSTYLLVTRFQDVVVIDVAREPSP
jgi:nitroimidazol reductase NimA-like FMN-containing flavoprotein (pyridoxamine 5'-phosphate oxidase superfamily)